VNCQEALDLLYEIIDKEASQIDTQEVQKHLDCCQDCLKKFQLEESLQALVKEKLKAISDIPRIDHLKAKVLSKLEQIDVTYFRPSEKATPFRIPSVALAAAASFIILIGAAFWGKGLYNHYTDYIPIERAHWAAAKNVDGFSDAQKTAAVLAGIGSNLGLNLAHDFKGLSLRGGQSEEIKGVNMAHFVYGNGQETVSVFVLPANAFTLPEDLMQTKVYLNGHCYLSHNCRGCWLVFHEEGKAMIITATTNHAFGLTEFNPASNII